ncbi:MAG: hypothetical protein HZA72_01440 [Candidatus Omnitrophica bacterium]|nr:hypothetical protein [Candidatus Omnitrophota bacterium]
MNKIFGIILIALMALSISSIAYCEKVDMAELVDQYKHATDLQRDELTKQFTGKRITGSGIVENVGEYDFFDISNDTGGKYYKVLTRQQETPNKVPYQVVFLYKDKDKVRDIDRGEPIEKEGNIIKLEDERLQIAVWIYDGELTSRERDLFK